MRYVPLAMMFFAVPTWAEDSVAAHDRQVSDSLRDVHDRGADLYNGGDLTGGYRMYQGGLIVARGMLRYHPELQKLIDNGMATADRQPEIARRAFILHELIEHVRGELRANAKKGAESLSIPPRNSSPERRPRDRT